MNKMNTDKEKYKVVTPSGVLQESESIGIMIARFGLLAIICIMAFLVAKYIVRDNIDGEKPPIDTSERL